ncbi:antibiotic biosynthesis monooxygenase [Fervidibacillus albus]|uniref:Antibiotic biosynthesis monooxygenase n=1 Tax=Fervidibacillus albus TaxID=2980026 RepID=A0A9E8RU61_9BACI|nr:putative quinol monooxygenase [Fervidibacillus albus]WAA08880.1 antibiotic biosynthesis monooxygenase [Fervidibacillus albus]
MEFVKSELLKLIEQTRKEEGCLQYDLHQDNTNPAIFVFDEKWQNRDLWQQHMKNEHLKAYSKATEGTIESFTVNEMSLL